MVEGNFKETEIGKIPEDWNFISLDEITNIKMGQSPPSKFYNSEKKGVPFFQGRKDFGIKYPKVTMWCTEPKRIANKDEILLSVRAPVGDINIAKETCCIGRGLSSISMMNDNNEFLYYLFQYNKKRLKDIFESEGTVFGCITKKGLHDFKVSVPNESEQVKIAKILSDLDAKIELNQKMNQTLEEIGQAIFKHWFVHFEFPNEEGKPYKSSGGEMVDSELGEIPKGWEVKKFEDCLKLIIDHRGKTPLKLGSNWSESGFRALSAKNIKNGQIVNEDSIKFVDEELYSKWMKNEIEPEDILLTSEAPLGELVSWDYAEKIVLSQRLFGIRADKKIVYPKYLYCFMTSDLFKYELTSRATGSTVQGIRQSELLKTNVIIPTLELTREFQSIVEFKFRKIALNNEETRNLSQLRDFLLPRLISGKIRVLQGK